MDPEIRDFKSLPSEEQLVVAQSFRDGGVEDLAAAQLRYVSSRGARFAKAVKEKQKSRYEGEEFAAQMRAFGH